MSPSREPPMPPPRRLLAWAAASVMLLVALTALVFLVPPVGRLDRAALQRAQLGPTSPEPDNVHRVAHSALPAPVAVLTLVILAAALARRRPERALAALMTIVGAGVTTQVLKQVLATPREVDAAAVYQVHAASYPSGHATVTLALTCAAVMVAPARVRRPAAALGLAWTLAVSAAMLVLHRHFPSDILAGWVVAAMWCLLALAGLGAAERASGAREVGSERPRRYGIAARRPRLSR